MPLHILHVRERRVPARLPSTVARLRARGVHRTSDLFAWCTSQLERRDVERTAVAVVTRDAIIDLLALPSTGLSVPAARRYEQRLDVAQAHAVTAGWPDLADACYLELLRCHTCAGSSR